MSESEQGQDSGAADSSDQAQVPSGPSDSHVSTDSTCQPSTSETVSAPSEQTSEADNSPDQSDSSVQ